MLARQHNDANVISIGARQHTVRRRSATSTRSSRSRSRATSGMCGASRSSPSTRRPATSPARASTRRTAPPPRRRSRRARGTLRPPDHPPVRAQLRRSRRACVEPAGPLRSGRRAARRAADDRCPRRRQADVPRIRGRRVAAGAPRHVRRVGLRWRHPDGCDDRLGQRTHGADEPARHVPRGPEPRRGGVRRRGRELAHLDRRAPPHAAAHVGVREGGDRHRDVPARAGRAGARAPAHRQDRRRPARSHRVRGARPRAGRGRRRQARARPARSTRGPRPRSGSRVAVRGRRRRSACCSWTRAWSPASATSTAPNCCSARGRTRTHPGTRGARGARAPPLARLDEAARHRRGDRAR